MSFIIYNAFFLFKRVAIGSLQHLLPICLAIIFAIVFIQFAKRKLSEIQQKKALHIFACFISLVVIVFHAYKISLGSYNLSTDLPLYLCSLMALLIPVFSYYRTFLLYEILLFWIVGGTLQAVLAPDIELGFPSFDYFRYWVVHLGLLIVVFYATFVFNMRPTFKSMFKSILALLGYVVIMIIINKLLNANYFYLNEKPQSASILDYFGEWPWYIMAVLVIVFPLFFLIYLPFYLAETRKSSR